MFKFLMSLLLICSFNVYAKTAFIKSASAPLLANPKSDAKVIKYIKQGDSVKVLKKAGLFYQVEYAGEKVYVSKYMLTSKKPKLQKINISKTKSSDIDLKKSARKRPSNYTSTSAGRGLGESSMSGENTLYDEDIASLQAMEKNHIAPTRGQRFLLNGK